MNRQQLESVAQVWVSRFMREYSDDEKMQVVDESISQIVEFYQMDSWSKETVELFCANGKVLLDTFKYLR